jgi:hypothetical protein
VNERERDRKNDGKLHDLIALCFIIIIFIKNEKASLKKTNKKIRKL